MGIPPNWKSPQNRFGLWSPRRLCETSCPQDGIFRRRSPQKAKAKPIRLSGAPSAWGAACRHPAARRPLFYRRLTKRNRSGEARRPRVGFGGLGGFFPGKAPQRPAAIRRLAAPCFTAGSPNATGRARHAGPGWGLGVWGAFLLEKPPRPPKPGRGQGVSPASGAWRAETQDFVHHVQQRAEGRGGAPAWNRSGRGTRGGRPAE